MSVACDEQWLISKIGGLMPPHRIHAPDSYLRLAIVDDVGHQILEALENTVATWIIVHDSGRTRTGTLDQIDFLFRDGWNAIGWDLQGRWILVYGEWENVGVLYYNELPAAVEDLITEEYLAQSAATYLAILTDRRGHLSPNADGWTRLLFD